MQDSATLAGSMSRWPVWASGTERASDTTGCSRPALRPTASSQTSACKSHWTAGKVERAGSWCLGPRSVYTADFGVVGVPSASRSPWSLRSAKWPCQPGSGCRWPQVFHNRAVRSDRCRNCGAKGRVQRGSNPVVSTVFRNEPFGQNVEGRSCLNSRHFSHIAPCSIRYDLEQGYF